MEILNDDKILAIICPYRGKLTDDDREKPLFTLEKEVAKEAQRDTLRQVVEWLESKESVARPDKEIRFAIFKDDWEELKKLAEE